MSSTYNNMKDLWLEFTVYVNLGHGRTNIPMCGLCGNTGEVNTRDRAIAPNGTTDCGVKAFCICPNGRCLKKLATGSKYGGSSVK